MLSDLRHAIRFLLRAKAWTAVVVVSLALGIGANTALFSAVNGLLLREVPIHDPDTFVRLRYAGRNEMARSSSDYGMSAPVGGEPVRATFSYPMFQQLRADNRTLEELIAGAPSGRMNIVIDGAADTASAFLASGNYFRVLGVNALVGRTFGPDDDQASAPPVAVVSHQFWRTRFAGRPDVVGRVVPVSGVSVTIVGVLPPSFTGAQRPTGDPADITLPLSLDPQLSPAVARRMSQPTTWWLQVMGRLKPGVTPAQVEANLGPIFQHTARAGFDAYLAGLTETERARSENQNRTAVSHLIVDTGRHGVYDANPTDLRAVSILGGVVVLVLLIVCANVANLLLSMATARQRELSVRRALGATRVRLIRQLLSESLLLSLIGGALGVGVSVWGRALLPGAARTAAVIDWRVLAFLLGISTLTGIVFGIAPALRATDSDGGNDLKDGGRGATRSRKLLGRSLLVVQVVVALVLLVGASLFLRTLQNLRSVEVGFDPQNIVLFRVSPQAAGYAPERISALYEALLTRLGAVAGVRSVSASSIALLSGAINTTNIFVQGRSYAPDARPGMHRVVVSPTFFETMGIPLVAGRTLSERDHEQAPKVVLINSAAARQFFPDGNPIGQRFGTSRDDSGQLEVVGVLGDVKYGSVREEAPPTMFVPYRQAAMPSAMFEVRTSGDPQLAVGAIREAVRQVDSNLPLMDISTQAEQIERRFLQERAIAEASVVFGLLATLLAAIGLFGLMSYNVARRTHEIGVRLALGARQEDVMGLVMRESIALALVGVVIGLAVAAGASRLIASQLFGLAPTDALSQAGSALLLLMVSAAAGYLPARRAARVDPMVALRSE